MIGENQVYTLKYNNMQFFLLDSNRELPYLWTQRQWLKEELEKSDAQWKIVVLHHPLYSIKGKHNNMMQRTMFNSLIQKYHVDLVLQGHEHAYARMTMHDENGKATTPVYTVSHCSPKSYRIDFDGRFDKFGIESRFYQYVRAHGDTLSVNAYRFPSGELYDSLDIVKNASGTSIIDNGKNIPEYLEFKSNGSEKDCRYMERINKYKQNKI